jgi:hypothetical protein
VHYLRLLKFTLINNPNIIPITNYLLTKGFPPIYGSFKNLREALLQILVNLREKNTPNSNGKSNKMAKFQKHESQVTVNIKGTSKWDVTRLVHILHSVSVFILNEN